VNGGTDARTDRQTDRGTIQTVKYRPCGNSLSPKWTWSGHVSTFNMADLEQKFSRGTHGHRLAASKNSGIVEIDERTQPTALPLRQQNPRHAPAAVERRDRQTDRRTLSRFVDLA